MEKRTTGLSAVNLGISARINGILTSFEKINTERSEII